MALKNKLYPLYGKVQHYAWGGYDYIPALLDITNEENKPYAEYWMGTHPLALAEVGENHESLSQLIAENKEAVLGSYIAKNFGSLPYLFKIMDVRDMLSIQVHPSKQNAGADYARENAAGIAANAPNRNYKDDNHKPELAAALGDFWLLHGFKPKEKMVSILSNVDELESLLPIFEEEGYEGLYKHVMEMPQEEVNEILQPLIDRIVPLYKEGKLTRYKEDFWAARAAITFNEGDDIDRGIFSVYLFNLVNVKKGDAIFQDAGVPHAYLEGKNAEIMANSDNVLRGGLTKKHIDVPELLKHVKCEATVPDILHGVKDNREIIYKTPAKEFELSYITLGKDESFSVYSRTGEVFIIIEGSARIGVGDEKLKLAGGEAAFVVAGQKVNMLSSADKTYIYRASAPAGD
ncbi:MAG: mannose-6-phosphate isomerase, class I [Bacteroidetes bacterium]|nr:mannose-6-phosphate isomerase, class I [Bacteroidota bacterium]